MNTEPKDLLPDQLEVEDLEALPVISQEHDDELQRYLDDSIGGEAKSEEFKQSPDPKGESTKVKTATFGRSAPASKEESETNELKQKVEHAKKRLEAGQAHHASELASLKQSYENKLVQVRRETTSHYQKELEKKMASLNKAKKTSPEAVRAEIEATVKSELDQKLAKQLQDEREKTYKEMKENMKEDQKMNIERVVSDKEREIRSQVARTMGDKIKYKVEQEFEENYEDSYGKLREEIKQKILDEVTQNADEEFDVRLEDEIDRLARQAEAEVEENTKAIKREIEGRLNAHIERLNEEAEEKFNRERERLKFSCLREMRENKEKVMREQITKELTESIEKELKENLPKMLEGEIRRDVEKKLRDELDRKNKEILRSEKERIKQKNEEKLKNYEAELQSQLDAELPSKVAKILEQKEKEIKIRYKRQLEIDKKSYEAKAKANFEANLAKELKKLEAEKAEFARQKSAYSVMLHQFETQKKEMAAKLREKELRLVKKQTEVKNGLKYIEPEGQNEILCNSPSFVGAGKTGQSMIKGQSPVKSPFKVPQSANRSVMGSENMGVSPTGNALLPFSRALVNKAINEIGVDNMLGGITLPPSNSGKGQYTIKGRKEIDELTDLGRVPSKKYI